MVEDFRTSDPRSGDVDFVGFASPPPCHPRNSSGGLRTFQPVAYVEPNVVHCGRNSRWVAVMIKSAFIEKQVERSKRERRTSPFLRRLVMNVVDRSASEFLGNAYSTRCFACSAAIEMLLKDLGIRCAMTGGAMCIVEDFRTAWRCGAASGAATIMSG